MDVYLHSGSITTAGKQCWHMIGLADEGRGEPSSFFFTKDDLRSALQACGLTNIKVYLEHGDCTKENIGEVVYAWVDPDDGLYVVIRFDDSPRSLALQNWIRGGIYTGLSLGYHSKFDGSYSVLEKEIFEISIVHKPFHNACRIKQIFTGNSANSFTDDNSAGKQKPTPGSILDFFEHITANKNITYTNCAT